MADLSPTLSANDFEANRKVVQSILSDQGSWQLKQPSASKRLRGCGLAILAADVGALAYRIAQICDSVATDTPCGCSHDTAGDTMQQTHELLLPESVVGEVINNLKSAGCKVTSDKARPKEAFDVYRFRLVLPSNADKTSLVLHLSATSNFLFIAGRTLFLKAEHLLDPEMTTRFQKP